MWEIWGGAWWGSMVEAGAETWGELMRGLQVVPSLGHTLLQVVEGEVRGAWGESGQGQDCPWRAVP